MADVKVAVARTTTPTSDTTFDVTVTGFGTPVAAMVIMSLATTDGSARNGHTNFSIGFTDGTNSRSCSIRLEDGVAGTGGERRRIQRSDNLGCLVFIDGTDTSHEIAFSSWITDGVRLSISESSAAAMDVVVVLFGGSDMDAYVGSFAAHATQNSATSVTGVGFQPDVIFGITCGDTSFGTLDTGSATHALLSFGVCHHSGGTFTQRCSLYGSTHNAATTQNNSRLETDSFAGQVFNDALQWTGEITAVGADGFDCTTRDGASGSDEVGFLALKLNGGQAKVLSFETGTSTGLVTYSTGFEPQAVVIGANAIAGVDGTGISATGVEGYGVCVFDADNEYSMEFTSDDGVATTNESQVKDVKAFRIGNAGAPYTNLATAAFDSFNASDFKLNYSAAPAVSRTSWAVAFEAASAAAVTLRSLALLGVGT